MTSGDGAERIVVWLKNGERDVYDSSYYTWDVTDGILTFKDDNDRKFTIYAMSNVHKVEIINY